MAVAQQYQAAYLQEGDFGMNKFLNAYKIEVALVQKRSDTGTGISYILDVMVLPLSY